MSTKRFLSETLSYSEARMQTILGESQDSSRPRDMFMQGIFIQGGVKNLNERVYPVGEIRKAVKTIKESINRGFQVLGELDHPEELNINLPNVSHVIVDMWMEGNNGMGKLKLLPTPMGNIARTILDYGVKLGVSSRGSGSVNDYGDVSDYHIVTVDIVAKPSAPDAYPVAIAEAVKNSKQGIIMENIASSIPHDKTAQKYFENSVRRFIEELKL